jgi:DNA-binding FrmR family transcriptional regulator
VEREEVQKDLLRRIKTVKGHLNGIEKMIEEGKGCQEVLIQIAAVRAALSKIGIAILEHHAVDCLVEKKEGEPITYQDVEEVVRTIVKFID